MFKTLAVAILFMASAFHVVAHPVAYKGSKGVMGHHSPTMTHNQLNYSQQYWWAVGAHYFKRPQYEDNRQAAFLSTNFLLKRWNGAAYQANIYTVLGAGQSELLGGDPQNSGLGIVQFDIEDREYYFLAKHITVANEEQTEMTQSVVRLGLAPYVGGFDDIHSWLILEHSQTKFFDDDLKVEVTPFLRIFYKNLLFEIGQSFNGNTKFNYIVHF